MKYEIEFTEQTADQTYMGLWELFHLSEAHFKNGDLSRNLRVTTEFKCVVRSPVSYTHLDVYKRQIQFSTVSATSTTRRI